MDKTKDLLRRSRNLLSHPPLWWKDNEASREKLIAELDAALAESDLPEQEPCNPSCAPGYCYCASLQRKPLTGEEIDKIAIDCLSSPAFEPGWNRHFARAIEQAHGIGETNGD